VTHAGIDELKKALLPIVLEERRKREEGELSAMKDERNGLPPALSSDGVHPLPAGYAIMAPLAEAGIAKALAQ